MSRNAALLLAARVTSALTTLAVLSFVARLRGPDDLGLVAVGLASGAILATLSDVGLGPLLVREGARDEARTGALLGALLLVRLAIVPLVLLGAWLVLDAAFGADAPVVWIVAAGLVFQQWAELGRSVFLSRLRVGLMAAHSMVENLAWLAVIAVLLATEATLIEAFSGGLAVFAVSLVVGLAMVRLLLGVRPHLPTALGARGLIVDAAPFALFGTLNTAYTRIDTILVGLFVPGTALVAAGTYFAASRLVGAFEYLPETLSRSLLPELSRGYVVEPGQLGALLRPAIRLLLFTGIPVPFGVLLLGPWLMQHLFDVPVGPYGWIVVGLAAVVPLRFFGSLFGATLTSADAQWRRVWATAVALGAVALVDVLLLPRIGIAGALVGVAAATISLVGVYLAGVSRIAGPLFAGADALRAFAAAAVALIAGLLARSIVPEPAAAAVFALVYLVLVGALTGPLRASPGRAARTRR